MGYSGSILFPGLPTGRTLYSKGKYIYFAQNFYLYYSEIIKMQTEMKGIYMHNVIGRRREQKNLKPRFIVEEKRKNGNTFLYFWRPDTSSAQPFTVKDVYYKLL
jgi:hypothetical protein